MRRELAPVDPAALGAHTLPVQSSWFALSSDEQLLAVCEGASIGVHALHALVTGSMEPVATWRLPGDASLKQVHLAWQFFCAANVSVNARQKRDAFLLCSLHGGQRCSPARRWKRWWSQLRGSSCRAAWAARSKTAHRAAARWHARRGPLMAHHSPLYHQRMP